MNVVTQKNRNLYALYIAGAVVIAAVACMTVATVNGLKDGFASRANNPVVQEAFR